MEEIHYLLGNSCNLDCDFCFWEMRLPDPPLEQKRRIIDQIADSGIRLVTISGGEPTRSADLIPVLEYMRSKGLRTVLHTNGLSIDEKMASDIVPFVSRVSLSLDGSTNSNVLMMRKSDDLFDHTVWLIKEFNELGVQVNVKTLVTKANKDDIMPIGKLLSDLPIAYWSLLEFNPTGRGELNRERFVISQPEFESICRHAMDTYPDLDIRVRTYSECSNEYCFISADGKVYTYTKGFGDVFVGDLETENLASLIARIEKK